MSIQRITRPLNDSERATIQKWHGYIAKSFWSCYTRQWTLLFGLLTGVLSPMVYAILDKPLWGALIITILSTIVGFLIDYKDT